MMLRHLAMVAAALVVASAWGCERHEGVDPSKVPEKLRADYDLFSKKCSKCHSLARPLSANITDDEQWNLYVNRMRRQPASGISPQDQEAILRFLHWYAADLRRMQAEKNAPPLQQSVPVLAPPPAPAPAPAPATTDGGAQ